ncbi:MAG TPA: NAD-dependent malic enzyme [Solirubrobacteraceae bacterium]|jgi:malate dehydrogenase (oxaloacetate-decarboxylating)
MPRGRALLRDPRYNRGTAFTLEERAVLGLQGLLPPAVLTLEQQCDRAYEQYEAQPSDIARNSFLAALHDRNEVLYYRLLEVHLQEMLPIIYAPVISQAIQRYSHEFQRPNGVYLSVDDIEGVQDAFSNYGLGAEDVDLLVATDAEAILGIGDWGANGMAISIGKLAIYTAAAGIHPGRVIPVMLDVGTDRESLLKDPVYVGNRHGRVRGERYDALVEAFVEAASTMFPHALLHFEDFGPSNARRILEQYRDRYRVFNDDMQGTGAITLAAILAGMRVAGTRPGEQRIVIYGAGTAGVGVADQIRAVMLDDGLSERDARARFWCVDRQGLLVDDMTDLRDFQVSYARPRSELTDWRTAAEDGSIGLADVVANVHPTILVGTSTQGGAFSEPIVREMAAHVERPLIFPLSNPTELIEAVPADVIAWTGGRGLVGTGTPWAPVRYDGIDYEIGQANNALIYPGIGLGTIVAGASTVTDRMLLAASHALASLVDASRPGAGLLPEIANLRKTSATVAAGVARQAIADGVAAVELEDPMKAMLDAMWIADYSPMQIG